MNQGYSNPRFQGNRSGAISAYRTASETVSPAQAIVMLYDGAIKRIFLAHDSIEKGEIEARFHAVNKAYAIVLGLQSHLDFDAGGSVAMQLNRYYEYILIRLTMVNLKNDPNICIEIIERLKEMRESWVQLASEGVNPQRGSNTDAGMNNHVIS